MRTVPTAADASTKKWVHAEDIAAYPPALQQYVEQAVEDSRALEPQQAAARAEAAVPVGRKHTRENERDKVPTRSVPSVERHLEQRTAAKGKATARKRKKHDEQNDPDNYQAARDRLRAASRNQWQLVQLAKKDGAGCRLALAQLPGEVVERTTAALEPWTTALLENGEQYDPHWEGPVPKRVVQFLVLVFLGSMATTRYGYGRVTEGFGYGFLASMMRRPDRPDLDYHRNTMSNTVALLDEAGVFDAQQPRDGLNEGKAPAHLPRHCIGQSDYAFNQYWWSAAVLRCWDLLQAFTRFGSHLDEATRRTLLPELWDDDAGDARAPPA